MHKLNIIPKLYGDLYVMYISAITGIDPFKNSIVKNDNAIISTFFKSFLKCSPDGPSIINP